MATYLAGKKATATIDGTVMAVEDGSYNTTAGADEVTNLNSGGFYEDVPTIKRATCSLKCIYDGDSPPDFDEGDIVALAISVPNGPGLSGNFRITQMTYPVVNPKAAVKYSFEASSNGAYVKTGGAQPEG
jgi:hypothetical protein